MALFGFRVKYLDPSMVYLFLVTSFSLRSVLTIELVIAKIALHFRGQACGQLSL